MADGTTQKQTGVRLAVGWPHDRFEHGVAGVPPLTTEFSDDPISDAKVKDIRKVARENDVPLRQTSADGDEEAGS